MCIRDSHLFDAVSATTDFADPRARSRAIEALAPTVAAVNLSLIHISEPTRPY